MEIKKIYNKKTLYNTKFWKGSYKYLIENEIKDIPPNFDIKKKIYRSYEIPIHFEISNHFFDKSKKN